MRSLTRTARIAALLGLSLTTLVVGPAAANGTTQVDPGRPDASIRFKAYRSPFAVYPDPTPWKGLDVRNTTGSQQTQSFTAQGAYERGTWLVFVVAVESEGGADSFQVRESGTGKWDVRYTVRGTDVTAAVKHGTYQTPRTSAGKRAFIRVHVRLGSAGSGVARTLTLASVANPDVRDVVRLNVNYSACGC